MKLTLSSPAFENGGRIPDEHSGFGRDISPELRIEGIAEEAVTMVVAMDDLGVPFRREYSHRIVRNIPVTRMIPAAIPAGEAITAPLAMCQGAAWGMHRYRGPKPPFHWKHIYRFYPLHP